jgi:asparagine synthase (glutamine-hydrolysing)
VCLFGEGADELGGYPSYLRHERDYRYLRLFARLPQTVKNKLFDWASQRAKAFLEVALGSAVASRRHVQAFSEEEKRTIWKGPAQASSYARLQELMDEVGDDYDDSFLRKLQHVEFRLRLPEFMLSRIDYATMAASVEARVPFLDHHVVEYSLRLPMSLKMKQGTPKYIFRSILSNYLRGEQTGAKKIGFGRVLTPFMNHTVARQMQLEILERRDHPLFTYINRKAALEILQEHHRSGHKGFPLWILYSLGKWLEGHQDYQSPEELWNPK